MFSILAALITLGGFVNAQGYVSMPFTKESVDLSESAPLQKRVISGDVMNQITTYTVGFTLGNGQKQWGVLDTTSSEIWVYSSQTPARFSYNPSEAQSVCDNFNLVFRDGTKAQGAVYKDKLTYQDVSLDATFGVSNTYDGNTPFGTFGIGPRAEKQSTEGDAESSFPYALKKAGQIETASYSLKMSKRGSEDGLITFGALDRKSYVGKLQLMDNLAEDVFKVNFSIDGTSLVGEIHSGSTDTYLPDDIVSRLAASVGGRWDEVSKTYLVDKWTDYLLLYLNFSDTYIAIPAPYLLKPINQSRSAYSLTVKPISQSNGKIILGENFLRAALTVYDLERNQIAIAQATGSDSPYYQTITSAGIPGASY
nr:aspartic protease-like protein GME2464 [Starmerella bombicola]